jgi:hypothetical protein
LTVHRVEALAESTEILPLDPVQFLTLAAITPGAHTTIEQLEGVVPLDRAILRRVLHSIQKLGLVAPLDGDGWVLTDPGEHVRAGDHPSRTVHDRRSFYFVTDETGEPHFLHFLRNPPMQVASEDGASFRLSQLLACVDKPPQWKESRGFPLGIRSIPLPPSASAPTGPDAWQRIASVQPGRTTIVIVPPAKRPHDEPWHGFAPDGDGTRLRLDAPVLQRTGGWTEIFPALAQPVSLELWQSGWRRLTAEKGIAEAARAGRLEIRGRRVTLVAARPALDRLRGAFGDLQKNPPWILAGDGVVRAAAPLACVTT